MNTIQEKTHTQNKRFHPVKYDKFDLMFNEYIIFTVVDKLNLDEWALCKPEMDLNIFSAIFSNFRYHPNATRTKQMFFKKHLFLLKHTSVAGITKVIKLCQLITLGEVVLIEHFKQSGLPMKNYK